MSSPATSSSVIPVQPDVMTSSARYSSASMPITAALTRIGRYLETSTTDRPSSLRLRATVRMRESLSPSRNPGGRTSGSVWFSSTWSVPSESPTGIG